MQSKSPDDGRMYRHHVDMAHIGRQINQAAKRAGLDKRVTAHWLRHSYTTHILEAGTAIHVAKDLLGHSHISTTETYAHARADGITATPSPLAALLANPELVKERRSEAEQPFKLRVFAG